MENTLKMLKTLDSQKFYNITLEELSKQYCLDYNPQILANAFIRNYDLINHLSTKFFTLCKEDVSSISLSALDYCLQNYDEKSTKAKFSSYFYSVLYNRFNTEQKSNLYKKRKVNYVMETVRIQELKNIYSTYDNYDEVDIAIQFLGASLYDNFENKLILQIVINDDNSLTELEKRCCNLMLSTECRYNKSEMAEILGVCRPKYNKILKSLQTKLKIILQP